MGSRDEWGIQHTLRRRVPLIYWTFYFDLGKHFIILTELHRHTFEDEIPAIGKKVFLLLALRLAEAAQQNHSNL